MKYLVVVGVITLIFYLLLYWRLRHYFPLARRIFGITRDIYRMSKSTGPSPLGRAKQNGGGEKLVRCSSCGTWVPEGRAVNLRSSANAYCSTECLENAGAEPRPARRSGER